MTKLELLKFHFGHDGFRPGQEDIVDSLLSGRDCLCVMPTGAGKSVCYQIPALLMDGITLVISPLISLMKDQVGALKQAGIRSAYLNSSLTPGQYAKALSNAAAGMYKIIYVAPERLAVDRFIEAFSSQPISLIAVDEAHCVSQWGQDFRPSYLRIVEFVEKLPYRPVIGAFTATATEQVREDVSRILKLRDPLKVVTGFDRPNLYFGVKTPASKDEELLKLLDGRDGQSGIVYCSTRRAVEEVCELLCRNGIAATRYHAGLTDEERRRNQDDFIYDRKTVVAATNAFGMGIDKSNVSFVVHYNMPKNIESYYQEAGRAGRDGSPAECILLYSPRDVRTNQYLIENSDPNPELDADTQLLIRQRDLERLKFMTFYCRTDECLRAFILKYFGEKDAGPYCGNCSSCEDSTDMLDVTAEAKAVLDCVDRCGQRYGVNFIIEMLRGENGDRVRSLGFDTLPSFGILAKYSAPMIRRIINKLLAAGYLNQTGGDYPVLELTPSSGGLYSGDASVSIKAPPQKAAPAAKKHVKTPSNVDPALFAALRALRSEIASTAGVPAYVIFTDATLNEMCRLLPSTPAEFLDVPGVGQAKLERYGNKFLLAIANYKKSRIR